MYKKHENLLDQWGDRLVDHQDGMVIVDSFVDYPREIVRVDMAMRALVKSKHKLFTLKVGLGNRCAHGWPDPGGPCGLRRSPASCS